MRFLSRLRALRPEAKAAPKPLLARTLPGDAVATPRRYDRLASEAYQQNVVAYRAINLVARGMASIPLEVMVGDVPMDRHPLLDLLRRPNPKLKGAGLLYQMVGFYLIAGNSYALKIGPDGRPPGELWLMRPDTMSVIEGADGVASGYRQTVLGRRQSFEASAMLHWKSFNPLSDWYGMAPLEAAAMAIDAHNEGSRWNLALIQNGGTPSGVLYQEDGGVPLTEAQFAHLKTQVEERHMGPVNAGRPLLLEGGLKWQHMGLSPKDMDWQAAKNMSAREIALAFGVPPQMLGIPDAQTYSNYAEARQSVWEDTIIPLASELVGELNAWLAPEYGPNVRLIMDLDEIPALEPKRQAKFDRLTRADFLTRNEKRAALGYGPNTKEDMDA
ncbi:phage portal protein [Gimibacter soli]|uniref:Phage portal protein n=1 Tax=Gimibacter soli TaxID=3024400 RepID=A0AAE9XVX9_9PROT|nr:phage portal protein [Gimibacter soli]WCL55083.1 phage portal protein [Gimibacter soli]